MSSTAYFAGFFDGEGNVDIRYRKTNGGKYQRFELRVCVVQVETKPLLMLQDRWGGSLNLRRNSNVSIWVVSGKQAAQFLSDVFEHLIVKRDEAQVALDFYALVANTKPEYRRDGKGKGFLPQSEEVIGQKVIYLERIREIRKEKGLASRADSNSVYATRLL